MAKRENPETELEATPVPGSVQRAIQRIEGNIQSFAPQIQRIARGTDQLAGPSSRSVNRALTGISSETRNIGRREFPQLESQNRSALNNQLNQQTALDRINNKVDLLIRETRECCLELRQQS